MELTKNSTAEVIDGYYDSWRSGIASFDGARLGAILAEDLDFEGPIAGKRRGADFLGECLRVEGQRFHLLQNLRVPVAHFVVEPVDRDVPVLIV